MEHDDHQVEGTPPGRTEPGRPFPIVGIGASAGGLRALGQFFKHVPEASGVAFVVIQHMDPQQEGRLVDLLQTFTRITVCDVEDGAPVTPDCVYVIPPGRSITLHEGALHLGDLARQQGRDTSVDVFFRSLAEDRREQAVGVVLSGRGSDGALGIKIIKAYGGLTLAQDPAEAEHAGMPRSAVATGAVTLVLPAAELGRRVVAVLGQAAAPQATAGAEQERQEALKRIFTQLRVKTGHDFTHYKQATILRRIERRMHLHHLSDIGAYVRFLRRHPEEVQDLFQDLLISVTSFFRDPQAFALLEKEVIPALFAGKGASDQVRLWVPGCATGEEAYSLAMLLADYAARLADPPRLQVFATDINQEALLTAREGLYPASIVAEVPPEYLERYFTREVEGYRVDKALREVTLFAVHNLLKDPPFSRLDLVACRNVLIYLEREIQERVYELFHYALQPDGYLFLGTSESAEGAAHLFSTVDKKHHLFQRRPVSGARQHFPIVPVEGPPSREVLPPRHRSEKRTVNVGEEHRRLLLDRFVPPSVVVNTRYDVVHVTGGASRYLRVVEGEATQNILKMVREELRLDLQAALFRALRHGETIESRSTPFADDAARAVDFVVEPLGTLDGFVVVTFHEVVRESLQTLVPEDEETQAVVAQLERDLLRTKRSLQSTIEELENANDELRESNEELRSVNEELQSTTEELETSQEELQSMNEELVTVNQELKAKIEELGQVNSDLQNLMASTEIGTVFLDRALCIKRYTPRVTDLFNLIPSDLGRPLAHVTHKINHDYLLDLVHRVLEKLAPIERELRSSDDRWYLVRLLPYRTVDDRIDGVVINFVDITGRKQAEMLLGRQQQELQALVENAPDIIARFDEGCRHIYVNPAVEQSTGIARQDFIGKRPRDLGMPEAQVALWENALRGVFETGRPAQIEFAFPAQSGPRFFQSRLVPEFDPEGSVMSVLSIARDITERRQVEEALRESEQRFRTMADTAPVMIWMAGPDKQCNYFNKSWLDFTGRTMEQEVGEGWAGGIHPEDLDQCLEIYHTAFDAHRAFRMEYRLRYHDGSYRWILDNGTPRYTREGQFLGYIGSCIDIHERREIEEKRFSQAFQASPIGSCITTVEESRFLDINESFTRVTGYGREEVVGKTLEEVGLVEWAASQGELTRLVQVEGGYRDREMRIRTRTGTMRDILTFGAQIEVDGQPCILTKFYDITEQKRLEREVIEAREQERRRIGQDLHDGLGQQLTGVAFLSKVIEQNLQEAGLPDARQMSRVVRLLHEAIQFTRDLSHLLSPVEMLEDGLADALEHLCHNVRGLYGIACRLQAADPVIVRDNNVATHLYRIVQEAVNNAIRHAGASQITISVAHEDEMLLLSVHDDGKGIDVEAATRAQGMGLRTMRYRAELIGATLRVGPGEAGGTVVSCRVQGG